MMKDDIILHKKNYKYLFATSVTLFAIIIGCFASVFIQQSEDNEGILYWVNPKNIFEFVNTQSSLNSNLSDAKISLIDQIKNSHEKRKNIKTYFIVDTSPSLNEGSQSNEYLKKQLKINSSARTFLKAIKNKKSSILLYAAVALEAKKNYSLMIYNGEFKDSDWDEFMNIELEIDQRSDVKNFNDSLYILTQNSIKVSTSAIEDMKKKYQNFNSDNVKTDIGKMLEYSLNEIDKNSVINIISDFDNDSKRDPIEILTDIDSLLVTKSEKIHQINLFIVSDQKGNYHASQEIIKQFEKTSKKVKVHYHPYKFNETDTISIEKRIKSYASLTFLQDQNIEFYRPFQSKFGESFFKSKIKIQSDGKYDLSIESLNEMQKENFIRMDFDSSNKRKFLKFNESVELGKENSTHSNIITLLLGESSAWNIDNAFLNINDHSNNYNLKYKIKLRDKLPISLTFFFTLFYSISFISVIGWGINSTIEFFGKCKLFEEEDHKLITYYWTIFIVCCMVPIIFIQIYIDSIESKYFTAVCILFLHLNFLVNAINETKKTLKKNK